MPEAELGPRLARDLVQVAGPWGEAVRSGMVLALQVLSPVRSAERLARGLSELVARAWKRYDAQLASRRRTKRRPGSSLGFSHAIR